MILVDLALLAALLLSPSEALAQSETDRIIINGESYPIPEQWREKKLDPSQIALPEDLEQLPGEYSYRDYRIYLRPEAKEAFVRMAEAAAIDGLKLVVNSGFRSLEYQRDIIERRLATGQSMARIMRSVAPPGYSEHHTGCAVDFVPRGVIFSDTNIYRWLVENAARFGFRESFPRIKGSQLDWEPWHWFFSIKMVEEEPPP